MNLLVFCVGYFFESWNKEECNHEEDDSYVNDIRGIGGSFS